MRIRAAFFDVDGTLVPFGRPCIADDTIKALDALRAEGVKVFVSSGRPRYLIHNLRDYPFDGYVCFNGGLVLVGNETLFGRPMDQGDVRAVVRLSAEHGIGCVAFGLDRMKLNFTSAISGRISAELHISLPPPGPLDDFVEEHPVYQFTLYTDVETEQRIFAPELARSIFPRWHPDFMDVTPDDTSKADGIARVAVHYGWSLEEVAAFGDGGNDIPMLRAAGLGVAMGNADASVKSAADYVTEPADRGGIAKALSALGLIRRK